MSIKSQDNINAIASIHEVEQATIALKQGKSVKIKGNINSITFSVAEASGVNEGDKIIVNDIRSNALKLGSSAKKITCNNNIEDIMGVNNSKSVFEYEEFQHELANIAFKLCVISELIPSIIIKDSAEFSIKSEDVENYDNNYASNVEIVVSSKFPVSGNIKANLHLFQAKGSIKQHYALTIGKIKNGLLARIHSSCVTGDVFGSLACDCRPQLEKAISEMAEAGGGVLLYLWQEGRGIGLKNKLLAYNLKEQGLDTVDANLALGFPDDDRDFLLAVSMLNKLEINEVELMTNNPRKISGLEKEGIKVIRKEHRSGKNKDNEKYLQVKEDKLGHIS